MRRRLTGGAGVITLTAALAASTTALPAAAAGPTRSAPRPPGAHQVTVRDGETQPVFSRADAVTQTVNIETTADSDRDGVRDRVQLRIMRPKETDAAGLRVPTILEASPYWAGINDVPNHPVDVGDAAARSLTGTRRDLAEVFPATTTTTSCRAATPSPTWTASGRAARPAARPPVTAASRRARRPPWTG